MRAASTAVSVTNDDEDGIWAVILLHFDFCFNLLKISFNRAALFVVFIDISQPMCCHV